MMSDKLKKLQKAEQDASDAYATLRREHDAKEQRMLSVAKAEIRDTLDMEYAERLKELRLAEIAAKRAREDAAIEVANETSTYAPGTKLIGWGYRRTGHYWSSGDPLEQLAQGVIEIVTRETVHPDNVSTYTQAAVGQPVVRLLKKDGAPSKRYDTLEHGKYKWRPEGQKPKGAKA